MEKKRVFLWCVFCLGLGFSQNGFSQIQVDQPRAIETSRYDPEKLKKQKKEFNRQQKLSSLRREDLQVRLRAVQADIAGSEKRLRGVKQDLSIRLQVLREKYSRGVLGKNIRDDLHEIEKFLEITREELSCSDVEALRPSASRILAYFSAAGLGLEVLQKGQIDPALEEVLGREFTHPDQLMSGNSTRAPVNVQLKVDKKLVAALGAVIRHRGEFVTQTDLANYLEQWEALKAAVLVEIKKARLELSVAAAKASQRSGKESDGIVFTRWIQKYKNRFYRDEFHTAPLPSYPPSIDDIYEIQGIIKRDTDDLFAINSGSGIKMMDLRPEKERIEEMAKQLLKDQELLSDHEAMSEVLKNVRGGQGGGAGNSGLLERVEALSQLQSEIDEYIAEINQCVVIARLQDRKAISGVSSKTLREEGVRRHQRGKSVEGAVPAFRAGGLEQYPRQNFNQNQRHLLRDVRYRMNEASPPQRK